MNNPHTVVVIGCNTAGLAVIRSLGGRPNIRIVAAAHDMHEIGCVSKYVAETAHIPHPGRQEREFVDFLLQKANRWKDALLIESGDYMAIAIAKHKEELSKHYHVVTADWSVLKRYIRKSELYALADECGVPHPKTFQLRDPNEVRAIADQVRFPCILKPVNSHEFVSRFNCKMFHIGDGAELVDKFLTCCENDQEMIVQEVIPGPETNLQRLQAYVDRRGNITSKFFNIRLRQHPPNFGVMRVGLSTEPDSEVEDLAQKLIRQGNYRGFCSVEFKRDERDGLLKLIEINVRMTRSIGLPIASGVDFPWLVFQDLVANEPLDICEYDRGVYLIELYPDLVNMILNPSKEKHSLREYLRPYLARRKAFAVLSLRDSKPFIKQTLNAGRIARSKFISLLKGRLTRLSSRLAREPRRKPKQLNLSE